MSKFHVYLTDGVGYFYRAEFEVREARAGFSIETAVIHKSRKFDFNSQLVKAVAAQPWHEKSSQWPDFYFLMTTTWAKREEGSVADANGELIKVQDALVFSEFYLSLLGAPELMAEKAEMAQKFERNGSVIEGKIYLNEGG